MGELSPVEEVFQKHMQRSLATYELYYQVTLGTTRSRAQLLLLLFFF